MKKPEILLKNCCLASIKQTVAISVKKAMVAALEKTVVILIKQAIAIFIQVIFTNNIRTITLRMLLQIILMWGSTVRKSCKHLRIYLGKSVLKMSRKYLSVR